jgi:Cu2+-exporting ATPase
LEAQAGATVYRLGRPEWALANGEPRIPDLQLASVILSKDGRAVATFSFEDRLRSEAREAVAALTRDGLTLEILSGDREEPVRQLASELGIPHISSVSPGGKAHHIATMAASGHKVLMVGDGLNDTPALVAAHASIAPASAVDIGRNAADFVFLRESLMAVPQVIATARLAGSLVRENLVLAVGYNLVAVPIAVFGYVTPLIAALAMSGSSLVVVANALRLQGSRRTKTWQTPSRRFSAVPQVPVGSTR